MPELEKISPWLQSSVRVDEDGIVGHLHLQRGRERVEELGLGSSPACAWGTCILHARRLRALGGPSGFDRVVRRSARINVIVSSHVRGISWPTDGRIGGSEKMSESSRSDSATKDASPPATLERHCTPCCTRSRRTPSGWPFWCCWMACSSHSTCLAAHSWKASTVRPFSIGVTRSHLVSTGSTMALGAACKY